MGRQHSTLAALRCERARTLFHLTSFNASVLCHEMSVQNPALSIELVVDAHILGLSSKAPQPLVDGCLVITLGGKAAPLLRANCAADSSRTSFHSFEVGQ